MYDLKQDHWKEIQEVWKCTRIQAVGRKHAKLQALRNWAKEWNKITERKHCYSEKGKACKQ